MNSALKSQITKYKQRATITSLNLLEELYEVAPSESHILIDD
jgi:hypothetical protein